MATDRERLFGADVRLVEGSAGLDVSAAGSGDLALAGGNDNIAQALTLRLRVRQGELAALGWPAFGSRLHELIGEPNNRRTQAAMMAHARDAVLRDPRVLRVAAVRVVANPGERDTVRLEMDIDLIDSPSGLNLVFDFSLGGA